MVSIKSIVLSLALAAAVSAQGASQITDGQVQVPTVSVPLSTAPPPPAPTTVASVYSTGAAAPTTNGTFTTKAPSTTASSFPGAGNMLAWSKEVALGAAGLAVGLALL